MEYGRCVRGGLVLIVATVATSAPLQGVAHAGRSFFGWLQGAEVMPERSVELQNWLDEVNKVEEASDRSESRWGFAPYIGITDQLELALPFNVVWGRTPGMPGSTAMFDYGVEGRYRLVTMDPEEAPPFAPMIRASVKRLVLARDVMRSELGFVSNYEAGSVVVGVDLAVAANLSRDDQHFEARGGAGVSVLVTGDLRLGAEVFTQLSLDDKMGVGGLGGATSWAAVGPNLSWTHGRFWVSATYGIGIYQIKDAPRMQWGIAF
jgi:hypothetical protein